MAERGIGGVQPLAGQWRDARIAGMYIHFWGGLLLGTGACVAAALAPDAFVARQGPTEVVVATLLSLAGLAALYGRMTRRRLPLYAAGELVALAATWQFRWLGAENVQAFVLAPGSYQIVIGALLPADEQAGRPLQLARLCSLVGAGLLLLPTLEQSFGTEPNGVYALLLALEALLIGGVGVGTRTRLLVLIGSVFVGSAALRGAALAVDSGVPIPLVIAGLALLLMGGATWLSLRARREAIRGA